MSEEDIGRSEELDKQVNPADSELKRLIVNYVGETLELEENVTVEDLVQVFAKEFPEFVLALAEENFLRGYRQALVDIQTFQEQEAATQAS